MKTPPHLSILSACCAVAKSSRPEKPACPECGERVSIWACCTFHCQRYAKPSLESPTGQICDSGAEETPKTKACLASRQSWLGQTKWFMKSHPNFSKPGMDSTDLKENGPTPNANNNSMNRTVCMDGKVHSNIWLFLGKPQKWRLPTQPCKIF